MPRHRDHNDVVGNLAPAGPRVAGEVVSQAPYVEVIEGRAYSFEDELARQRDLSIHTRFSGPPRPAPSPFRHRSLRRG